MYGLTVTPSGLAGVSRVATRARVGRNARGTVRMMTPTVTRMIRTRGVERANEDATMDDDALARGFVDLGASIAGRGERAVDAKRRSRVAARAAAAALAAATSAVTFAARAASTAKTAASTDGIGTMLVTSGALLVASAFFSLAETSITTLYPWKVRELADQETSSNGVFNVMRKDVTRFLTTILIGTTFSGIMATALITEAALRMYGEGATTIVTAALTVVMLVFTEIAPKSVAVQHAKVVARFIAKPIFWLSLILYPLGRTCQILVNAMFSVFGLKTSSEPFVSEEELKLVLAGATKSGEVESAEKEMIQNVLDLEETVVRDVMTPLVRVHGVESNATLSEFRKEWMEHKYSRVPVWEDRVDNIVGIMRASTVMLLGIERELNIRSVNYEEKVVSDVMSRDAYFVPESMSVSKLLRELMSRKTHMCVVVNEFGGTVGIATLEDCVEEIVGEIYDEQDDKKANADEDEDDETPFIREVSPGEYLVDTRAALWKLAGELSLDIPDSPLYETVGGFVCDLFGSIPKVGASIATHFAFVEDEDAESIDEGDSDSDGIEVDGARRSVVLTVTEGDARRVNEVKLEVTRYRETSDESDEEAVLVG